jgi:hypothetical protein
MNRTFPILRDANRLLLDIESSVRLWPRCHKYTLGVEKRGQAVKRAWSIPDLHLEQPRLGALPRQCVPEIKNPIH